MRIAFLLLLLLALAAPARAQTVKFITGYETGDASEVANTGGGSVQTSTVITGAYSFQSAFGVGSLLLKTGIAAAQTGFRARIRWSSEPSSITTVARFETSSGADLLLVQMTIGSAIRVKDGGNSCSITQTDGSTLMHPNTTYLLRIVFDTAAGGVIKVWINDSLEINTTHSGACAASTDNLRVGSDTTVTTYWDDVLIQTGATTQPPAGQVIARQGVEGTPTYTGWTKASCTCSSASNETCAGTCSNGSVCCDWSQTPLGTTEKASTSGNTAQTVKISAFSTACKGTCNTSGCCGHGGETVGASDTINACKAAVVAKVSNTSNTTNKIRRRLNSSDTDTIVSLTTSDKYFDDCCWTPASNSHMDTAEVGFIQSSGSRTVTVEDVWLMCDYNPSATTTTTSTTTTTVPAVCGNGVVEVGEQCDDGANNGTASDCCSSTCQFKPAGSPCADDGNPCTLDQCNGTSTVCQHPAGNAGAACRASAGTCDVAETCTGTSTACPADAFQPSTMVCRVAVNECDIAENCSGTSPSCPTDAVKAVGTACTDDGNPCTTDLCNGTVGSPACVHNAGNAGTVCRASAGICDAAETCTGTNAACPPDAVQPSTIICRAAAGECDLAESCTGSSAVCPSDAKKSAGTACPDDGNPCTTDTCDGTNVTCQHPAGNAGATCRASAGVCDVAETCTGTSTTCPADGLAPSTAQCRSSAGECDPAENCTGTGADCPADARSPSGTACTPDANPCTLDQCDGANVACQHLPGNAGAVCRAAAGNCDVAETCDGTSTACPADTFQPTSTVCRAAAGECDVAELCPGNGADCPPDAKKPAGTPCADDGDPYTIDRCDGSSDACQHTTVSVSYVYDELGRLVGVVDTTSGAPTQNVGVYTYDGAGNLTSIARRSSTASADTSIISFNPVCGAPGTSVTIYGTGFTDSTQVKFNGTPAAAVTVVSAIQITATVPSGATAGPIAVTPFTGAAVTTRSYDPDCGGPTISGLTPTIGNPGTVVSIAGMNFDANASNDHVKIAGREAAVTSASSTTLTVVAPTSGSGAVSVTTPAGTAIGPDFFVVPSGYTLEQIGDTLRIPFPARDVTVTSTDSQVALIIFDVPPGNHRVNITETSGNYSHLTGVELYGPDGAKVYVEQTRLGGPCCFKNTQPLRPGTYTLLVRPLLNQTGTLTFRFDIDDITTDVYKSTTLNEYYPLACGSIAGPQIVYVEFPNTMINQSATLVVTLFAVPMGQEPLCVNAVLLNGSYSGCSPYCTPSGDCSATVVLSATATLTNPIGTLYTAMVDALYGAGGVSAQVTSP